MNPFTCIAWLVAVTLFPVGVAAQNSPPADSSALAASVAYAIGLHTSVFGPATHLFNGTEYVNYSLPNYVGHQFFVSDAPQIGSLTYDGFIYPRVPLLYDIKLDQLIVSGPSQLPSLSLVSEKVSQFILFSRTFLYLSPDSGKVGAGAGFYNLLVDGPAQLLAKRRKTLLEETVQTGKEGVFTEHDQLFLRLGKRFYQLRNVQDLWRLLPAQKTALRNFARRRHLNLGDDNEENALTELVNHYNSLPPL